VSISINMDERFCAVRNIYAFKMICLSPASITCAITANGTPESRKEIGLERDLRPGRIIRVLIEQNRTVNWC